MIDWKIINQALIGINWLDLINENSNAKKTISQILHENKERLFIKGEKPLNIGVLLMASYILFVYPKEGEMESFDFNKIDTSKFIIHNQIFKVEISKEICRRLRNSISHSDFEVNHEQDLIIFRDSRKDGSDAVEFEINIVEFGEFISGIVNEFNKQDIH